MSLNIAIVGAGNAACVTAMYYHVHGRLVNNIVNKITIYYDPKIPIERVGQGSVVPITKLISKCFDINWHVDTNIIKATPKTGILYENWGILDKLFHPFQLSNISLHYVPQLLSKLIIESGMFEVVEKNVVDIEKEIDADYIFDCRGKPEDYSEYDDLINPINSVILSRKEGRDLELTYTRCVATPHGWTFVIPNHDSVSYGYLYNDKITLREIAEENFIDLFDVVPDGHLKFKNYIAKDIWRGERTILNGNRLCFLEPLEATSVGFYQTVCSSVLKTITQGVSKEITNQDVRNEMQEIQNFILWHYQTGSKYDTPFWDYAKSLRFDEDKKFNRFLHISRKHNYDKLRFALGDEYGQWSYINFKNWDELTV
mgnify:CR=1 FL=1